MLDRLAIVIVGRPDAGKTSTLKDYSDYYYDRVDTFKKGWRYRISPFKPKFETIKIWGYFLPSSPTESKIPLHKTISTTWLPDVLLMAEQYNGSEYLKSIHFLMANGYHIKEYNISNSEGKSSWDKWPVGDKHIMSAKLLQRREEIAEYIRKFLISKCTI